MLDNFWHSNWLFLFIIPLLDGNFHGQRPRSWSLCRNLKANLHCWLLCWGLRLSQYEINQALWQLKYLFERRGKCSLDWSFRWQRLIIYKLLRKLSQSIHYKRVLRASSRRPICFSIFLSSPQCNVRLLLSWYWFLHQIHSEGITTISIRTKKIPILRDSPQHHGTPSNGIRQHRGLPNNKLKMLWLLFELWSHNYLPHSQ